MGLLSGLEKFGFKSLDKVELYEKEEKKEEKKNVKVVSGLSEPEMLFEKSYKCPICQQELKVKTMKQGKAKLLGTDVDLRANYQNIDPLKYGAILCNGCGYAALTNYFNTISDPQVRLIQENVSAKYEPSNVGQGDMYTYDEALEIHKMALLNAVVKHSKSSEKAYICLKSAWLLRGKAELMVKEKSGTKEELIEIKKSEREYLEEAYKGFISAIETESTPKICGMDAPTVSYLCAALAYEIGLYAEAQRMVSRIYAMPELTKRTKDRCIDLKELIQEKMKNQKA